MVQGLLRLACLAAFCALPWDTLRAQELHVQPTPFSVQIDLNARSKDHPLYPIWLQDLTVSTTESEGQTTVYRLLLRQVGELNQELLLRLFFEDTPEKSPRVSAWSELGDKLFESEGLGGGLGLPSSASVIIPTLRAAYVEISVPGDGSNLTSLYLNTLRSSSVKHAWDFDFPQTVADPFGNPAAAKASANDQFLYGRVEATIDNGAPVKLPFDGEPVTFEFDLAQQPLVAVLSFEVLNPDVEIPVEITANSRPLGAASMLLPDLADPAFRPQFTKSPNGDCPFRYNGWIKCQKVIPTTGLCSGTNKILFASGQGGADIAVRSVVLQLKYPWDNATHQP